MRWDKKLLLSWLHAWCFEQLYYYYANPLHTPRWLGSCVWLSLAFTAFRVGYFCFSHSLWLFGSIPLFKFIDFASCNQTQIPTDPWHGLRGSWIWWTRSIIMHVWNYDDQNHGDFLSDSLYQRPLPKRWASLSNDPRNNTGVKGQSRWRNQNATATIVIFIARRNMHFLCLELKSLCVLFIHMTWLCSLPNVTLSTLMRWDEMSIHQLTIAVRPQSTVHSPQSTCSSVDIYPMVPYRAYIHIPSWPFGSSSSRRFRDWRGGLRLWGPADENGDLMVYPIHHDGCVQMAVCMVTGI